MATLSIAWWTFWLLRAMAEQSARFVIARSVTSTARRRPTIVRS